MSDELMSAQDLAARLGKSADYWLRQARAKRIPHRRLGRTIAFTEDDVAAILTAARVDAEDPLRSQTALSRARGRRSPR